jgi:hypothetical protein
MGGGGLPRPPTAQKGIKGAKFGIGVNLTAAQRATSAVHNIERYPKMLRYEKIIQKLKKLVGSEKTSLRMIRTMASKEVEQKNHLEKVLRQCVEDVKAEIYRKRTGNKSVYSKSKLKKNQGGKNVSAEERQKIVEVLLS